MKQLSKLIVCLFPVLLFVGCAGEPPKEEEVTAEEVDTRPVAPPPVEKVTEVPVEEKAMTLADLQANNKIYFDYDRSEIKPEFRDIVMAHAEYLAANPGVRITIEGHCDERGTREYNIALGERRANAVLKMLSLNGVSRDQLETVSYGEERPDVEGHDESAWKFNRRAVFLYQ